MSQTGEQPAAREPQFSLSFDRAVVLLGLFASVAAAWAGYRVTQADVEAHGKRLEAVEGKQTADANARSAMVLEVAELRGDMKRANEKLDDVKEALREMKVVNARGRQ